MRCSGTRLALADLRSAGDSTGASAGGSTGSTVGDSLVVTVGDSAVSTGSAASGVSMQGVDCSSSSLGTGCTGMLEGSFLKSDEFLVTVRSPFWAVIMLPFLFVICNG